jgi:hypothetical protein
MCGRSCLPLNNSKNNSKGNLRTLGQVQEAQHSQEEFRRQENIFLKPINTRIEEKLKGLKKCSRVEEMPKLGKFKSKVSSKLKISKLKFYERIELFMKL